jgi:hypothetical protein
MWLDYEKDYREALSDPTFLCWRELGARQKAKYVIHVPGDLAVESVIEIGCGTGSLIQQLHSLGYARKYIATDLPLSALRFLNKRVAVASFGLCVVKKFVPVSLYLRLFTTHSTFLRRAIDQRSPSEVEPRGAARLLQVANTADSVVPLKSR